MPTPTSKDAKQALYAVAGVADLAVSTIRHLPAEAAKMRDRLPDEAAKTYGQLVRRGETLERLSSSRFSRVTSDCCLSSDCRNVRISSLRDSISRSFRTISSLSEDVWGDPGLRGLSSNAGAAGVSGSEESGALETSSVTARSESARSSST